MCSYGERRDTVGNDRNTENVDVRLASLEERVDGMESALARLERLVIRRPRDGQPGR